MKKLIIYIFILMFFSSLNGQTIEFSGGVNLNNYRSFHEHPSHFSGLFKTGFGYSFNASISDFKIDSVRFPFKIGISFNNYNGNVNISNGGLGSGYTTNADIEKYSLGLSVFPLYTKAKSKINISLGLDISFLLKEKASGYHSTWGGGNFDTIYLKNESYLNSTNVTLGVVLNLGYMLNLKNNWFFIPRFTFYVGVYQMSF